MNNRHEAALRAALAERDLIHRRRPVRRDFGSLPVATNEVVARIVEAALAADDMDLTERDATALQVVTKYLAHQPEQGEWEWDDHCEGIAGGILAALEAHGFTLTRSETGEAVLCSDGSRVHDFQGERVCPGCGWAGMFAAEPGPAVVDAASEEVGDG